jgi:hypothetical protein
VRITEPERLRTGRRKRRGSRLGFNATIIEACSCPMFCHATSTRARRTGMLQQAGRSGARDAVLPLQQRVPREPRLRRRDEARRREVWVAGDLGADFSKGTMGWAILHFDPS